MLLVMLLMMIFVMLLMMLLVMFLGGVLSARRAFIPEKTNFVPDFE
jgi:hypothetical protein